MTGEIFFKTREISVKGPNELCNHNAGNVSGQSGRKGFVNKDLSRGEYPDGIAFLGPRTIQGRVWSMMTQDFVRFPSVSERGTTEVLTDSTGSTRVKETGLSGLSPCPSPGLRLGLSGPWVVTSVSRAVLHFDISLSGCFAGREGPVNTTSQRTALEGGKRQAP